MVVRRTLLLRLVLPIRRRFLVRREASLQSPAAAGAAPTSRLHSRDDACRDHFLSSSFIDCKNSRRLGSSIAISALFPALVVLRSIADSCRFPPTLSLPHSVIFLVFRMTGLQLLLSSFCCSLHTCRRRTWMCVRVCVCVCVLTCISEATVQARGGHETRCLPK